MDTVERGVANDTLPHAGLGRTDGYNPSRWHEKDDKVDERSHGDQTTDEVGQMGKIQSLRRDHLSDANNADLQTSVHRP